MIKRIDINGQHTEIDDNLRKYVNQKIGKLDHYMAKHVRESVHAEVKLKEEKVKNKNNYTCEVILHLPGENVTSKDTTMNMFAAVDIVEAKLKNQLKKYKETHSSLRIHRRVLARLRRRG